MVTRKLEHDCRHEGCDEASDLIECRFCDGEIDGRYCWDHVPSGFCKGCGLFSAGIESFDFAAEYGIIPGFCEECSDQLKHDCGEDEERLYEDMFDEDYEYELYGETVEDDCRS
jgi:hypothetical protein